MINGIVALLLSLGLGGTTTDSNLAISISHNNHVDTLIVNDFVVIEKDCDKIFGDNCIYNVKSLLKKD